MPPRGTQKCTDRHAERIFIEFSAGSKRMHKAAAAADDRVDQVLWRLDRCEICEEHGPCVAPHLLRGGLGGPGLGLDVLDDCAPSAALLLLVGHDFPDCEALLATRGAHLPEAETLYVGRWKVGVDNHWLEGTLGAELTRLGQVEDGGGRETVLLA